MQRINVPAWIKDKYNATRELQVEEVIGVDRQNATLRVRPVFGNGAERCYRCNRALTDDISMQVGFGEDCCAALGLPRPDRSDVEGWVKNAEKILGETEWEMSIPRYILKRNGFELPKVAVQNDRQAVLKNGNVVVTFSYDQQLVSGIKAAVPFTDRKFMRNGTPRWVVSPGGFTADFKTYLVDNNFQCGEDVMALFANAKKKERKPSVVSLVGKTFEARFEYDVTIKETVKAIPGARYNGIKEDPAWVIPASIKSAEPVRSLTASGFTLTPEVEARIASLTGSTEELRALSYATDTDFRTDVHDGLRPFQHVAIEYIEQAKRVIVGDTMGLGKTVEALAAAEHLGLFPMIVICPASLKENWRKEVQKWFPHRSVEVLNGKNGEYTADITIINYDILASGWEGNSPTQKKSAQKSGRFVPTNHTLELAQLGARMIVMDEGHYVKEKTSQRSRAAYYLSEGAPSGQAVGFIAKGNSIEYRLWMSGTPILNRPEEIIFPLQVLGVFEELFGTYMDFVFRYCDAHNDGWGLVTTGSSNERELNHILRGHCYIRRTTEDVLDEMPDKVFAPQWVEITNRPEYQRAEDDLIEYVGDRARVKPEVLEKLSELDPEDHEAFLRNAEVSAEIRAEMAETLVKLGNLRRLTAEGKLAASIKWIEEFLKSGESLIVFANHRFVVNAIAEKFNAPKIMGGMNNKVIERGKEAFQAGEEQLIVLNIEAGGVGHTLTAAHHVAFIEYPYNPGKMDQAIQRAYARLNDLHGVTVWQVIAENTMDETMINMIEAKRQVVNAVTDGTEKQEVGNFMARLVEERGKLAA